MQKNEEKLIALPYMRVSSKRQEIEGSGLDSQEHRCRLHCDRNGYPVEKVFRDSFTGGGDFMQRPAMSSLLAYIDKHPTRKYVVVFDDLSRFARDTIFHLKLRAAFHGRGVKLECLNYEFNDSVEGVFTETIMAASNQLNREQNRRQVIQKQKAVIEAGGWPFGGQKIGYKRVVDATTGRKTLIPNKHAESVIEALEGFAYKRFEAPIDVARFMVDRGVFGKQNIYRCTEATKKLLVDPFYAGVVSYKPWDVSPRKGWHSQLISVDVLELNRRRLNKGTEVIKRFKHEHNPDFELCGFIQCKECGSSLRGYWCSGRSKKYPYYECKKIGCSMRGKSFKRDVLHKDFNLKIDGYTAKSGLIEVAVSMFEDIWNKEVEELNKIGRKKISEIEDTEKQLSNLSDKIADAEKGSILEKQLIKRLEEKTEELENIKDNLLEDVDLTVPSRTASSKVFGALKSPLKLWTLSDINQKQKLFHFFFDEQLIYEAESGYRTSKNSCIIRLFDRLNDPSTVDVEVAGIEPASSKV